MRRSLHLFYDIIELAAAIRADGTSARYITLTATGGKIHCTVTSAGNRGPDAEPEPYRARHPLVGAALQEKAAAIAREIVERRADRFAEEGGRGQIAISADGAVHLDLSFSRGHRLVEALEMQGLRKSALSHLTERAVCVAAALADDARLPSWASSEAVQRVWMEAVSDIDPLDGPNQTGMRTAAEKLVLRFKLQDSGLTAERLADLLRQRLFPDMLAPFDLDSAAGKHLIRSGQGALLLLDADEAECLKVALAETRDPVLRGILERMEGAHRDAAQVPSFEADPAP